MRSSRLRLGSVFDKAAEAVFFVNDRGLVYTNRALARLLEDSESPGAMAWERWEFLLAPPADLPPGASRCVCRPLGEGDQRRWIELLFLPLGDQDGSRQGVLGIAREGEAPFEAPKAADSVIAERIERLRDEQRRRWGFDALPARSPAMHRLLEQVRLAISVDAPATLVGEAGAGKEALARLIHHERTGVSAPFVPFDCRCLPPDQQRAELLGRAEIADPNDPQALGILRAPAGGTLFLKGPFELDPELQRTLVRELGRRPARWRLIAGERQPLERGLEDGRLSEEFFYFLSGLVIPVPPLRERSAELRDYCDWILQRLSRERSQPALPLSDAVMEVLTKYDWPGNLRELEAVLAQAASAAGGFSIEPSHLPRRVRRGPIGAAESPATPPPLDEILAEVERRLYALAMRRFKGNKSKAAAHLGVTRARFHRRWEQFSRDAGAADDLQEIQEGPSSPALDADETTNKAEVTEPDRPLDASG